MRVFGRFWWISMVISLFIGCASRPAALPEWPSSPQADEQWSRLEAGEDPFQREVIVVEPSGGSRPLWNFEALGTPPRVIRVGERYPVSLVEGKKRRPEIAIERSTLHVWQGGVDLNRGRPAPSFSVDLGSKSAALVVDQPSYWTYSCETIYRYKGETLAVPCRWTNFYSK